MKDLKDSRSDNTDKYNTSNFIKYTQLVLLLICIGAFIAALIMYGYKVKNTTIHYTLNHTICTDSTGVITAESRILADSIFNEIQKHEKILEDKYQYFIEQKSNTQDILTIGSIILGIIVSLVGFFGYSTIQSIEEKAKKIGENAAKENYNDTTRELIDKRFAELLQSRLWPEYTKKIDEDLNKFKRDKMSDIDDLKEQIESIQIQINNIEINCNKSDKSPRTFLGKNIMTEEIKPEPNEF